MKKEEMKIKLEQCNSTMNNSQRSQLYFEGQEVDHIPYNLLAVEQAIADIYGFTTADMRSDIHVMEKIIKIKKEVFGLEGLSVGLELNTLGEALGSVVNYPEIGIGHVTEHILKSYADFDRLKCIDPYNNDVLTQLLERGHKLKDKFPNMGISTFVSGPISDAVAIRPIEQVLRDTRLNIRELKELLEFIVKNTLTWVKVFSNEFGNNGVMISDPVSSTNVLSVKQFEEFSLPYLKKLVDGIYEITGIKPLLHICGHSKGIWAHLSNLNISTISVDNCEDLYQVKEELGDKFAIMGNVNPVDILRNGTVEEVVSECVNCMRKAADSPSGYTLDAGCQIPIGTPKENLLAFVYAARHFGKGAKIGNLPKGINENGGKK